MQYYIYCIIRVAILSFKQLLIDLEKDKMFTCVFEYNLLKFKKILSLVSIARNNILLQTIIIDYSYQAGK